MNSTELKEIEDKIRDFTEKLSRDEQKVLYMYLYHLGHRILDAQQFVSNLLRKSERM